MTVHFFDSTGEAYDACQCDDTINTGDVLVIESEQVVGVAHTWPVAITRNNGVLHQLKEGGVLHPDLTQGALEAVALAGSYGWEV